ncbi:MAG: alpha/beta hydrolase fold domain-containing protein [Streptosporangiales bacterium]|nr:alpha/beta hydrolase fold domain-containing protein [Streptosporangiales bacterium]
MDLRRCGARRGGRRPPGARRGRRGGGADLSASRPRGRPPAVDPLLPRGRLRARRPEPGRLDRGVGRRAGRRGRAVRGLPARPVAPVPRRRGGLLRPATDLTDEPWPPAGGRDLPVISYADMRAFRRYYLGDADPSDPKVSPAAAADHTGLPPALIQVAEHDPLRDDGLKYAGLLRAAGVPVRLTDTSACPTAI